MTARGTKESAAGTRLILRLRRRLLRVDVAAEPQIEAPCGLVSKRRRVQSQEGIPVRRPSWSAQSTETL